MSYYSALIKQVNKSIDGTADDEDEGVPTDQAIRAGLELLKVNTLKVKFSAWLDNCWTYVIYTFYSWDLHDKFIELKVKISQSF